MTEGPMAGRRHGERGERVRAVRFAIGPSGFDDNVTVPPGTLGTITRADHSGPWVRWDNGSTISLLADCDEWEVV